MDINTFVKTEEIEYLEMIFELDPKPIKLTINFF